MRSHIASSPWKTTRQPEQILLHQFPDVPATAAQTASPTMPMLDGRIPQCFDSDIRNRSPIAFSPAVTVPAQHAINCGPGLE